MITFTGVVTDPVNQHDICENIFTVKADTEYEAVEKIAREYSKKFGLKPSQEVRDASINIEFGGVYEFEKWEVTESYYSLNLKEK